MNEKPNIICLTPVKNEAWILEIFLAATSLWADYIIIADQNSTDNSAAIAKSFPKVILIENKSTEYNEVERQKLLLNEARKIQGKKLLITLDADEFFTSNFIENDEWSEMINSSEGSVFGFQWINLLPGFKKGWYSDGHFPWAMMDDGSEHRGEFIHSPRLPVKDFSKIIKLDKIKVLHYQYINWNRMKSKHRYYQCIERIKFPEKSFVEIYRTYHHMYAIAKDNLVHAQENWFNGYEKQGIEIRNIKQEKVYWFDLEVIKMFDAYGTEKYRKLAIWDINWNKVSNVAQIRDPRNIKDKLVQFWFKHTQKIKDKPWVLKVDRFIKFHL